MTNRAATATEPALFVAPAHVAVQRVVHEINAFKFGEFCGGEEHHAHQDGGQGEKRQQHDGHCIVSVFALLN
jgi:hypothetical protein